jgi:dienelactone hydrolase
MTFKGWTLICSWIPWVLGMVLVAAGSADGHELVVSDGVEGWPLLVRAEVELLGGFWLLIGRSARAARGVALAAWGVILAYDLARAAGGNAPRHLFGRVAAGPWWVPVGDLLVLVGLLRWRPASRDAAQMVPRPGWLVGAALIAAALGIAIDRSQVGQYPIIATTQAGRSNSGLDYLVYLPDGYYRTRARWPLILTLHGRGESGDDIGLVRAQGLPRRVEAEGRLPFVIVAPQSPGWGWDVVALSALLDEVLGRYRIDADRVYLVGNSMGGTGTWAMAASSPWRFAAIAPICGGADPVLAARLRNLPTWAFHGADDPIVPPEQSKRMIAALKDAGGDARLTLYPGVGHDAWTRTFADPQFYEWLARHRRPPRGVPGRSS